ncbi:methyltransferase domain-containing protein [Pseudodesulfovibrio cashew]|uniref:Methyltransferase domain-containing protein n=1 Tax=Pseudodesulfovibrio cashew TaxID=2678688 RepID=A0A6I6JFF0_9BACT|nr:class I SAM-dependent methyltransferase [Pseudodesulfovibrio cashew]QGY41546.1 methyltransferase domain-containing protein [Pseudodesulfovibrio cashew]
MTSYKLDAYGDGWEEPDESLWKTTAEGYDDWIANEFQDQYEINWSVLSQHMDPALRLLDVGCGPGSLSIRLSQYCHEVWGVDLTPEMVEIAERKSETEPGNAFFLEADACDLPFESHSFDTVMSVNALQTMDQPEMALMEMNRVLKPGGELLLITYCYGDSSVTDNASLLNWIVKYGGKAMWHSFKLPQLETLLQARGFEVIEARKIWEEPVVGFLRARSIFS